jgi:hypothetical protein
MSQDASQVTPASQWSSPRKDGMVVDLPSGNKARVRRALDLVILLKTGQIPNPLSGIVNDMIRNASPAFPTGKMDETAINQMLELVDKMCEKCFVEPRVVIPGPDDDRANFDPGEGAISIDDLDIRDRFFVFGFVQGGPADLAPFRDEPNPDVATAPDGEGVQPEAEQPAGTG